MLEAITFDYDGTIAPTSERQFKWFQHWAKMNNKMLAFKDVDEFLKFYNHHCGKEGGVQNVYDALNLPCDMKDRTHPVWHAYEEFNQNNPAGLYPGMKETIEELWKIGSLNSNPLKNRRLRLGINSTNSWRSMHNDLEEGNILQYFDCFITDEILRVYQGNGDSDSLVKPAKVSLALMLNLLGSEGSLTLHVGDTLNDLRSSQKVMRLNPLKPETLITIGACYGYEGREKLELGAETSDGIVKFDYYIDKPEDLIPLVKKLL